MTPPRRHPHEGQVNLGKAIRNLRKQIGITQTELGKAADLAISQISHIESGDVDPTFGNVRRIANALGTDLKGLALEEAAVARAANPPPTTDEGRVAVAFGRNVRRLRRSRTYAQEELADLCAMHRTAIGMIERGERQPRLDTLLKLIGSLEVSGAEILRTVPMWVPEHGAIGHFEAPQTLQGSRS